MADALPILIADDQRDVVEALRLLLKAELEVDPLPETERLAHEIRSGEVFNDIERRKRGQFTSAPARD